MPGISQHYSVLLIWLLQPLSLSSTLHEDGLYLRYHVTIVIRISGTQSNGLFVVVTVIWNLSMIQTWKAWLWWARPARLHLMDIQTTQNTCVWLLWLCIKGPEPTKVKSWMLSMITTIAASNRSALWNNFSTFLGTVPPQLVGFTNLRYHTSTGLLQGQQFHTFSLKFPLDLESAQYFKGWITSTRHFSHTGAFILTG